MYLIYFIRYIGLMSMYKYITTNKCSNTLIKIRIRTGTKPSKPGFDVIV